MFRAIIYTLDHKITILYPSDKGNWFTFNSRSYRKDREAICQVMEEDGKIHDLVESIYVEGNPVPIRSSLDLKIITMEHWKEKLHEAGNKKARSLWDILMRR